MSASRRTKQKEAILEVLKSADSHPTANWIYEQVRKKIPHISLGTVYRDLKMLARNGEIAEVDFASNQSRYDGRTGNHYHFRCLKCDRFFDINEKVDLEIDKRVALKTGFDVFYHYLEFCGVCRDCRSKNRTPNENAIPRVKIPAETGSK